MTAKTSSSWDPHDEGIILYKIRYPETLRKMSAVPMLEEHETEEEQLKLAVSLIESMETSLDKMELKDQYQDAVREMIQAKVEGKELVTAAEEEPQVIDSMSALKQSIEASQSDRKPMANPRAPRNRRRQRKRRRPKSRRHSPVPRAPYQDPIQVG